MRWLKKKIALAKKRQEQIEATHISQDSKIDGSFHFNFPSCDKKCQSSQEKTKDKVLSGFQALEPSRAIKNIVKNFGRAICNFAASGLARPYLNDLIKKEEVDIRDFIQYVRGIRKK